MDSMDSKDQDFAESPADAVAPDKLHAACSLAFSDYVAGPTTVTLEQWPQLLARHCVDLGLSRVALRGDQGEVLALALVAPRPSAGRWRLATMGAVPEARGCGAAPMLLDSVLRRARAAGMAGVELECFAQNGRALALYRNRGFEPLHALHGFIAEPLAAGGAQEAAPPVEPDPAWRQTGMPQAFAWLDDCEAAVPDLPLQRTSASLSTSVLPLEAWQLGSAQLIYSLPDADTVQIACLTDRNPGQDDARTLLHGLRAAFPGRKVNVTQLQRMDVGGQALLDCGFEFLPLHQLLMRRAF